MNSIKLFLFLALVSTLSYAGLAPVAVPTSNSIRLLKPQLDLGLGLPAVLEGSVDPTLVAVSAPAGSLYLRTNGLGYLKADAGSSTNWGLLGASTASVTSVNSKIGAVTLTTDDVAQGSTNKYLAFPISAPNGTNLAPSYRFDSDTGMYSTGDGSLNFSTNGVFAFGIDNNQAASFASSVSSPNFIFPAQTANTFFVGPTSGGAVTPSFRSIVLGDIPASAIPFPLNAGGGGPTSGYCFDSDTCLFSTGDGNLSMSTNNVSRMSIDNNGEISMGAGLTITGNISAANYPPAGPATYIAGFDGSGVLGAAGGLTSTLSNGAYFLNNAQTYNIPVDGTPGVIKVNNFETEFNAANPNTDQSFYAFVTDNHFDRSHGGNNAAGVTGFSSGSTVEGSGTLGAHTAWSINQGLQGDSGGTTTNATSIAIGAGASALYNVGSYSGISGNFNAQATSVVGDVSILTFGTSGDFTGNHRAAFLNQVGAVGGNESGIYAGVSGDIGGSAIMLSGEVTGDVTGSFTGASIRHDGESNGFTGVHVSQIGSPATTNNEMFRGEFGNGTASSKTAFTAIMGDGATSGSGRILDASWGAGDYSNRISLNLGGGSGDISGGGDIGINLSSSSGTSDSFSGLNVQNLGTATNWTGASINGSGTSTNLKGVDINLSGITSTNQKVGLSINDGALQVGGNYNTGTLPPSPFFGSINSIGGTYIVASGFPASSSAMVANNLGTNAGFDDDMGPDGVGGLVGYTSVGFIGSVQVSSGKTVDTMNLAIAGASVPGGSGGTITNFNNYAAAGLLPGGGTVTATNMHGFHALAPLCGLATNCWGIKVDDPLAKNSFAGEMNADKGARLSTSGSQPTCDAAHRGLMWNIEGGAGVADIFQVCQKDAADAYGWVTK